MRGISARAGCMAAGCKVSSSRAPRRLRSTPNSGATMASRECGSCASRRAAQATAARHSASASSQATCTASRLRGFPAELHKADRSLHWGRARRARPCRSVPRFLSRTFCRQAEVLCPLSHGRDACVVLPCPDSACGRRFPVRYSSPS